MSKFRWLPADLDSIEQRSVFTVAKQLDWDLRKVRAFAVALLEDANDHNAASRVNDLLQEEKDEDESFTDRINFSS